MRYRVGGDASFRSMRLDIKARGFTLKTNLKVKAFGIACVGMTVTVLSLLPFSNSYVPLWVYIIPTLIGIAGLWVAGYADTLRYDKKTHTLTRSQSVFGIHIRTKKLRNVVFDIAIDRIYERFFGGSERRKMKLMRELSLITNHGKTVAIWADPDSEKLLNDMRKLCMSLGLL